MRRRYSARAICLLFACKFCHLPSLSPYHYPMPFDAFAMEDQSAAHVFSYLKSRSSHFKLTDFDVAKAIQVEFPGKAQRNNCSVLLTPVVCRPKLVGSIWRQWQSWQYTHPHTHPHRHALI